MSKLRLTISMSVDGFVAGPSQSVDNPLGIGGERLHEWLVPLQIFQKMHGGEGGGWWRSQWTICVARTSIHPE